MVNKTLAEHGGEFVVIFKLPADVPARSVCVVGEFNDWQPDATPMSRIDGEWRAELRLPQGTRYRFRYLVDYERWENDWAADDYEPNEFGGDDSVVDLMAPVANDVA